MNCKRISEMEQRLIRATQTLDTMEAALAQYETLAEDIRILDDYLGSTEWHQDRADDKAGLLPKKLRRGVLSEDAIWNLLERHRSLQEQLKGL